MRLLVSSPTYVEWLLGSLWAGRDSKQRRHMVPLIHGKSGRAGLGPPYHLAEYFYFVSEGRKGTWACALKWDSAHIPLP
ncbi:unnamed protein product [Arctogadus glacialis]